MKALAVLICLFVYSVGNAQSASSIRVLSGYDSSAVSFARIEYDSAIILTDRNGQFCLLSESSQFTVRCLGFQERRIDPKTIGVSKTIMLTPKVIRMPEFTFRSGKVPVLKTTMTEGETINHYINQKASPVEICTGLGFIESGPHRLHKITVHLLKGDIDNALRLHIYKPSASGEPGEEILDSNIIIVNKNVRKGKYSITFSTMPVVNDSFVFIGLEVTGLNVSLDDSFPNYGPSLEFFESDKPFKSFIRRNHDPMWTPKLLSASSNRYYALNVVMDYY